MSTEDFNIDPDVCANNTAAYVLGALSEHEHDAFRQHMEVCSICREEVAALQVVTNALPAVAPQLSAPPALKQRVMTSVREDLRRDGVKESSGLSWWPPLTSLGWGTVFATAITVVAIAVAVIALSSGPSGGTRLIRAEVTAPRASASLYVSRGHAQLDISGMPQTSPRHVYEVWIKRSGAPQPTDVLFTVTARGDATVGVPGSIDGVKAIMVTSEPLGGTRVPTTSPVIIARPS